MPLPRQRKPPKEDERPEKKERRHGAVEHLDAEHRSWRLFDVGYVAEELEADSHDPRGERVRQVAARAADSLIVGRPPV